MDGKIKPIKNPDPATISDKTWRFILNLDCQVEKCLGLPESISNNLSVWRGWFQEKDVENMPLPLEWEENLTRF